MFDQPIKTIEQAKEFFVAMGCSTFHMSRAYPKRYEEYRKMNIPEVLAIKWRQECFENHFKKLFEANDYSTLWVIHSSMADLIGELKTNNSMKKMLTATQYLREKVPFRDRVIVAETINGRKSPNYCDGLIYLSYELQSLSLAKKFVDLSIHFAKYEVEKTQDFKRCLSAIQICNQIMQNLNLSVDIEWKRGDT